MNIGVDDVWAPTSCPALVTPRAVVCQVPLSIGFPRQEYWSRLPFPSSGDLLNSGIEPRSPALQPDSLPNELQGIGVHISFQMMVFSWYMPRSEIAGSYGSSDAEAPVFWSSDVNSWLIGKTPDVGEDWGQKEKRASEDEIAGWHHQCNGHELGQTLGDDEGQWGLACCSPWSCRVRHNWATEQQQQ